MEETINIFVSERMKPWLLNPWAEKRPVFPNSSTT
jgi:hypothetical protein